MKSLWKRIYIKNKELSKLNNKANTPVQQWADLKTPFRKISRWIISTWKDAEWDFSGKKLEWTAISSSRGSSQPRDWTRISSIAGQILYHLSHQGSLLVISEMQLKTTVRYYYTHILEWIKLKRLTLQNVVNEVNQ